MRFFWYKPKEVFIVYMNLLIIDDETASRRKIKKVICLDKYEITVDNFSKRYAQLTNGANLPLEFRNSYQIILKKTRFGGGIRTVTFSLNPSGTDSTQLIRKGKTLYVYIGPGLPNNSSIFIILTL